MANLNSIIRTILTTAGKANDAMWALARFVRDAQTNADTTYDTVRAAWQEEASAAATVDGRAVADVPAASTVRQMGAAAKLWGSVADGTHSPYHAYAWRALAYETGADGKRTPKTGDDLQAAWDSIPATRPPSKPAAKSDTVKVAVSAKTAERLQELAKAAGVDVDAVIVALLDK